MRQNSRTFCAFLDIRKAFDVAWREGALLKPHRAGISAGLWHLVIDFVSDRAAVRIDDRFPESWDVAAKVVQGAVLSSFFFDVLIYGLATAIKRAYVGVACGPGPNAPLVHVLLHANDVVIFGETAAESQRALDAAAAWANAWRFHFSVGPNKSAVMTFGRGRATVPPLHVGEHALPRVRSYTYFAATLHERL